MNTIVLQLDSDTKHQFIQTYQDYQVPSPNPHIEAFFKLEGASLSIYFSGKAVFQGKKAVNYAQQWEELPQETEANNLVNPHQRLIGTDEVGNGSYFGGLAVVASYVTPADESFLQGLGVDDSKKITDQTIRRIAPLLKETIPHVALLLSPKKYNEVIETGYNAVSVKVALHNQAIYLLLKKGIQPENIVIDAFTSPKNYHHYLVNEKNQFEQPVSLIEKAESRYLAVAVSSIIARDLFLENLEQLSQQVGVLLPSGAGHKSDVIASQLLQNYGTSVLKETAKWHFANTKKAHSLLKRGTS